MKKFQKTATILFGCALCAILTAQNSLIDSIEHVLASDRLKNPEKAELLLKVVDYYMLVDTENYSSNALEALKLEQNTLIQQELQKQQKQSIIMGISLVVIFALFAIAVFFYRKMIESNREITIKNREMEDLHTVKDKLFSVVAHDLRSPIASLISLLNLMNNEMLDAETQARLFKDVSKRVEDVNGLLDNLLRWTKSQMQGITPAPAYFDVREKSLAITEALHNMAAAKWITLNNRIEKQEVYADLNMFAFLMRNIVTNALKYTSEGGEVTLASELSGDMLVVSVKDTGIGMPQEVQDKLFKLSETQSRRGTDNESGIGLGLVLCADFVKANGGKIWFNSIQDEGSTFFFSVPTRSPIS